MRRFEEQYRIQEGDDVLDRENAVHQDLDLRLDAVELLGQAFAEGNRADIDALIAAYRDTVSGLARQVQELLGQAEGGISADAIAETADRLFLTAARRASILADLRGTVDPAGDTLEKLYDLVTNIDASSQINAAITSLKGGADTTLKALSDRITQNASDIVLTSGQIAAATAQLAAGVPTLSDFLALSVDVASQKFGIGALPSGFVEDYGDSAFIDPTSTGYFLDTNAGQIVGGVGAPPYVAEPVWSLPPMISNNATANGELGHVATASSENVNAYDKAYNAFDNDPGSRWDGGANTPLPALLTRQIPTAIVPAAYTVTGHGAFAPTNFSFLASADGVTYDVIDTRTGQGQDGVRRTYPVPVAYQKPYRFFRLSMTAGGNQGQFAVQTFQVHQLTPAYESQPHIPYMNGMTSTVGNVPGYSVSSSDNSDSRFPAWNPFRTGQYTPSVETSCWAASTVPAWISQTTPVPRKVAAYAFAGFSNGSNYWSVPRDFKLQATNVANPVDSDWVTLDTRIGYNIDSQQRSIFSVASSKQAKYLSYRLYITAYNYNGYNNTTARISLVEFLEALDGIERDTSIPYMTGPSAPAGYAVSETSAYNSSTPGWKALSGVKPATLVSDASGNWLSAGGAPQAITLTLPAAVKFLAYKLYANGPNRNTLSWKIRGSQTNNGLDWVDLDVRAAADQLFYCSGFPEARYFVIQNPGSYRYLQFYATQNRTSGDNLNYVGGLEFLQGTSGNMDLRTLPYIRNAGVPGKVLLTLDFKVNAGALNINNNVKALVSRNAGGQFTPVTLSLVGPVGRGLTRYQSPPTDISGQPVDNRLVSQVLLSDGMGINLDAQICLGAA